MSRIEALVQQIKKGVRWEDLSGEAWTPADVESILESVRKMIHIDPGLAAELADIGQAVAAQIGDDFAVAIVDTGLGIVRRNAGRFQEALAFFANAIENLRRVGDPVGSARAQIEQIRTLMYMGRYEEALRLHAPTASVITETLDQGRLQVNIGVVYAKMGRYEEAKTHLSSGAELLDQASVLWEAALARANLATVYVSTDEVDTAREIFDHCAQVFNREGMRVALAKVDLERSFLAERTGHYDKALNLLREGEETFNQLGMQTERLIAQLHAAEIFLKINLLGEALQYTQNASKGFEERGMRTNWARSEAIRAKTLGRAGRVAEAQDLFLEVRGVFQEVGAHEQVAEVNWDLSEIALLQGRLREALERAEEAQVTFEQERLKSGALKAALHVGEIHQRWGQIDRAEGILKDVRTQADARKLDEIAGRAEHALGNIAEARGDLEEALSWYVGAIERLERMRALLGIEEVRISFMAAWITLYEDAVWTCLTLGRRDQALELTERSKSRTLMDLLEARTLRECKEKQLKVLREQVLWLRQKLHGEEESDPPRGTRGGPLRATEVALEQRMGWSALKETGGTTSLKEIQAQMDHDTVILEYYETRGLPMVFLIEKHHWDVVQLRSRFQDIERRIMQWEFDIEAFDLGEAFVQRHQKRLLHTATRHLRQLYDLLIRPLRPWLRTKQQMIVIPHGSLHKVPFHALWDGDRSLNERYEVSYAPSLTVLAHCMKDSDREKIRRALIIGASDEATPRLTEEVNGVARRFEEAQILSDKVSDSPLRCLADSMEVWDVVHVACHGVFRQDNPNYSFLTLGDARLTAKDMRHLNLNASLVTLSACYSGTSAIAAGDELLGMVRGMLSAGARALLVSLWRADDACTTQLMLSFYDHLERGRRKAEALRKAQTEVRKHWPHPYYWAPFVLIGNAA